MSSADEDPFGELRAGESRMKKSAVTATDANSRTLRERADVPTRLLFSGSAEEAHMDDWVRVIGDI